MSAKSYKVSDGESVNGGGGGGGIPTLHIAVVQNISNEQPKIA